MLITGVLTNVCVETTAREAFQKNFNVIVVSDCTAAYTDQEHFSALQNISNYFGSVAKAEDILKVWSKNKH